MPSCDQIGYCLFCYSANWIQSNRLTLARSRKYAATRVIFVLHNGININADHRLTTLTAQRCSHHLPLTDCLLHCILLVISLPCHLSHNDRLRNAVFSASYVIIKQHTSELVALSIHCSCIYSSDAES